MKEQAIRAPNNQHQYWKAAPRSKKLFADALAFSTLLKFRGKLLQSANWKGTEEHYTFRNLSQNKGILSSQINSIFTTDDQSKLFLCNIWQDNAIFELQPPFPTLMNEVLQNPLLSAQPLTSYCPTSEHADPTHSWLSSITLRSLTAADILP